jgi:hypothetical protein
MKNNNLIFFENKHAFKIHFKTKLYRDSPEIAKAKSKKISPMAFHIKSKYQIKVYSFFFSF